MSFIAYKAFRKDLTCQPDSTKPPYQYKEGEIFELPGLPVICDHGFHFCKYIAQTLEYYPVDNLNDNAYAQVEVLGDVVWDEIEFKGCTNKLKILKVYTDEEILEIFDQQQNTGNQNTGNQNTGHQNTGNQNTGHQNTGNRNTGHQNTGNRNTGNRNTGHQNTGNRNTGHQNTGHRNTGNQNTGHQNTGDWNTVDRETGFFNTREIDTIRVFNKNISRIDWENAYKPNWLYFVLDVSLGYKESFKKAYENASKEDQQALKLLPGWDADVFFEISGIRID